MDNVIAYDDKEKRLAVRTQIEDFEQKMKDFVGDDRGIMDEVNAKGLKEYLVNGAYIRMLDIPAGVTIVSKLWNRERLWIIISGEIVINSEQGKQHIVAPHVEMAPFGSKVAIYAVKDTKWAAITGVDSDDLEKVEEEIEAKSYSDITYPWDLLEDKK